MIHSKMKAKQVILLAGLLLVEGKVPPMSVAFLAKSYIDFSDISKVGAGLSLARMGRNYGCTKQSASKHAKILEHHGLLIRVAHSQWNFNWDVVSRLNKLANLDI